MFESDVAIVSESLEIVKLIVKILFWLGCFTSVFLIIFYYLKFRYKEKSLLIEKNIDVDKILKTRKFPGFKMGLTIIGIAIGGIIYTFIGTDIIFLISFVLLFGGIGLIIGHNLDKRK